MMKIFNEEHDRLLKMLLTKSRQKLVGGGGVGGGGDGGEEKQHQKQYSLIETSKIKKYNALWSKKLLKPEDGEKNKSIFSSFDSKFFRNPLDNKTNL